jgi:hypothetical protein
MGSPEDESIWATGEQRNKIDDGYAQRISAAFQGFMKTLAYQTPPDSIRDHHLRDQFFQSGVHTIVGEVVPSGDDPWAIEVQLVRLEKVGEAGAVLKTSLLTKEQGKTKFEWIVGVKYRK